MGNLWQKKVDGKKYEVRRSRQTIRLYKDGVCHSEYNPGKVITGSFCDLLFLPAYFHPVAGIKRILVLGVGGGGVINQVMTLLNPDKVVGVELDPVHLFIARRFFSLEHNNLELVESDAVTWLENYSGGGFDLIIEDLYTEVKRDPVRIVNAGRDWFELLLRHLNRKGKLVMNFVGRKDLHASAYFTEPVIKRCFKSAFQLTIPELDNYVGAFLKQPGDSSELRDNLKDVPVLREALESKKLNYRIRKLKT